jgi:hypothetical protein
MATPLAIFDRRFNETVRRDPARLPGDFMFALTFVLS